MSGYQPSPSTPAFLNLAGRLRNIPVLPTSYGLLLGLVLIAILLGALNYENNLGLILAFLLAGVFLISLIQVHRSLARLEVKVVEKSILFAGRVGFLEAIILNRENLDLSLLVSVPEGQPVEVTAAPGWTARLRLPLKPAKRGWLTLDYLTITTKSPFGLWHLQRRLALPVRLLVYPQPLPGPFVTASSEAGNLGDRISGSGVDDFLGLRPYVPGDLIQRLAWKASSRGQGLFSKEFGGLAGATLDFSWQIAGPGGTETRLSRLCHLVLAAGARQLPFSLTIPGQVVIPAGSGETHSYRCLRTLALFNQEA